MVVACLGILANASKKKWSSKYKNHYTSTSSAGLQSFEGEKFTSMCPYILTNTLSSRDPTPFRQLP